MDHSSNLEKKPMTPVKSMIKSRLLFMVWPSSASPLYSFGPAYNKNAVSALWRGPRTSAG